MSSSFQTELSLPVDARMLRLAQDYVRGLAQLAGLPEDQAESLALAVWEACEDSIEHAFEGEDSGTLKLVGEVTPAALTLSLHDQGLPFYQTREPVTPGSGPESPDSACLPCRGLASIHQCVDEVRWIYHGVEGNELRLTKDLAGVCRLPDREPETTSPRTEAVLAAAPGGYTIRLLRPGDGIHLARLMYRVYGYSYTNEDFYYPDRLDHDLDAGRHVGVVAVAGNGEIVGHAGVERPDLGPLAELGQLAVAPVHRGQGLRKLMGDRLQEEIKKLGLVGLFAEAVTIHTISQEGSDSRGLHPTGIKLLDWQAHFKTLQHRRPRSSRWEREAEPGLQRETMVFYFKYLAPPGRKAICAPSRHRGMLGKIYKNLEVDLQFLEPSGPTGPGELKVHYDQATGVGIIQVNRIGIGTLPEIYQARRDLCDMVGAKVVGLYLPLAQGGTPYLCEAVEADGFFFSGVQPHFAPDGDFLRLQYLHAELDPARIHLSSPFAKELLTYVLQEKEAFSGQLSAISKNKEL
ncbi:MAG: GNAT family N-acetyltransferase [Deltaproteobacteria bacterium]|nr:GNAT family N-acetyltransferase [Deltaproteobacteria bacterium]